MKAESTADEASENGATEEETAVLEIEARPETDTEGETSTTVTGMEKIGGVDEVEMLVAVHSMFIRYDADDSGAIDSDELRQVHIRIYALKIVYAQYV